MVGPVQNAQNVPFTPLSKNVSEPPSRTILDNLESQQEEIDVRQKQEEGTKLALEPRNAGVSFRPIENPRIIQARLIDRKTEEVIREAPTTPHIRFSQKFRQFVADSIGQSLDVQA